MYDLYMSADPTDVSISEARERLADVVDRARELHQPVFLSRRGRRVAAVVDADDLERLLELAEDMADIRAADEARREMRATGALPVPWDEVKAELGL
jgi:prevent-host-death family protein